MIIKGKVRISAMKWNPHLERIEESSSETMTYRLAYRGAVNFLNCGSEPLTLVVYEEP